MRSWLRHRWKVERLEGWVWRGGGGVESLWLISIWGVKWILRAPIRGALSHCFCSWCSIRYGVRSTYRGSRNPEVSFVLFLLVGRGFGDSALDYPRLGSLRRGAGNPPKHL